MPATRRVVEDATIRFAGVDMLDRTPLLDLKPYAARLDAPDGEMRSGWFDTISFDGPITPAGLAALGQSRRG